MKKSLNIFLVFFLLGILSVGCKSSAESQAEELNDQLSGYTFQAKGLADVAASAENCGEGGSIISDSDAGDSEISITFGNPNYTLNINGENLLGFWSPIDNNTIEVITSDDEILELDLEIDGGTITFALSDDWIKENC